MRNFASPWTFFFFCNGAIGKQMRINDHLP
jgi:hypothetical protein